MKKIVAIVLLALLGLIAFGCAALSEYITPTPVNKTGLIPMGLGLAGMGGLGGLLGLMRKRPGDVTPIELNTAVKGKDRQMREIVAGVARFMKDFDKMTEPGQALRMSLRESTNSDTKKIVAALQAV